MTASADEASSGKWVREDRSHVHWLIAVPHGLCFLILHHLEPNSFSGKRAGHWSQGGVCMCQVGFDGTADLYSVFNYESDLCRLLTRFIHSFKHTHAGLGVLQFLHQGPSGFGFPRPGLGRSQTRPPLSATCPADPCSRRLPLGHHIHGRRECGLTDPQTACAPGSGTG